MDLGLFLIFAVMGIMLGLGAIRLILFARTGRSGGAGMLNPVVPHPAQASAYESFIQPLPTPMPMQTTFAISGRMLILEFHDAMELFGAKNQQNRKVYAVDMSAISDLRVFTKADEARSFAFSPDAQRARDQARSSNRPAAPKPVIDHIFFLTAEKSRAKQNYNGPETSLLLASPDRFWFLMIDPYHAVDLSLILRAWAQARRGQPQSREPLPREGPTGPDGGSLQET